MWEAATEALEICARDESGHGWPAERLPGEIASYVAGVLRDLLATGNMPPELAVLAHRSGALLPSLAQDKLDAVLYIRTVQARLVPGKRPRETIAARFGVTLRAVDRWKRETPEAKADPARCDPSLATREGRAWLILRTRLAARHWRAWKNTKAHDP